MGLDIIVTYHDNKKDFFSLSENMHSKIFSDETFWPTFKNIRKIKDYYKTNVIYDESESIKFIEELVEINKRISNAGCEVNNIISKLQKENIKSIRVCGD
ncbi:hypothetical protein ROK90_22115 [Cronobacter dublinensis]|uniref:hypothetical protein n=1 Tax=Cronobacter dublinensis TaxID=413497 RepID=UPI0023DD0E23|nr:hypothetical protein [Cronobacter dublinensis]MDT3668666.1 hypothetical protein [Cronobacter dublinensis]WEP45517.1 hypothetical protein NNQ27_00800 [Cronobacter dublinensis]